MNKILFYTLIAIVVIAVYITANSYYTQVAIYEEKELFKLDCIANAVAYNISGDDHNDLIAKYPTAEAADSAMADMRYKKIHMQISMAQEMTKVPSEIYTVIRDTATNQEKFLMAISTKGPIWLSNIHDNESAVEKIYKKKGGMVGRFETPTGTRLGAMSPVMNKDGQVVGMLEVEETFDSFLAKSRDQIYFNIGLSLIFIAIIGTLMFFSVKSILKRQRRLEEEKAEIEMLRQELVANVSHDLRTPLASIHGYIETLLMKKDSLDEDTKAKYLNTTLQSTEKLKNLVDELFELSKLESKERKLNIESFSAGELLLDIANNFKISAQEKGVQLQTDVPQHSPMVFADLALIDRVVSNLLSNAIKYCNDGDHVNIKLEGDGHQLWISITDTGAGIEADDLPHIFNRFHKGKGARQGTGLGLAIVKNILEMHNSHYDVHSKKGEGTTFRFSLNTHK
jgi:signal transduction histidine kinase